MLAKMNQIRDTLISEQDDFSRDDVEFSYDEKGNIDNINDVLWRDERITREKAYEDAIKNIDEIIQLISTHAPLSKDTKF